jgi:hypothetical protein
LALSSRLVSLRCRCLRTSDEVSSYGGAFRIGGGTGLGTYSQFRAQDHVDMSHPWGYLDERSCHGPFCRYSDWCVLNQQPLVGIRTGLYRVVKVYHLCRVKTIQIAVSMVMGDTSILLDIHELFMLFPSLPPSFPWNLTAIRYVSFQGQSQWWEVLHCLKNMFSSKIVFIKSSVTLQIKLTFMQMNHTTFFEASRRCIRSCTRGCVDYKMYSWKNFYWYSEYYDDDENYDVYNDAEGWGLVDYIDCMWLRWSRFTFYLPVVLSGCNKFHKKFHLVAQTL